MLHVTVWPLQWLICQLTATKDMHASPAYTLLELTIGREEHAFSQKKNQDEGDEVQLAEGIHGVEQAFS